MCMRKMHDWEEAVWAEQDAVPVQSLLHWDISWLLGLALSPVGTAEAA